MSKPTLYIDSRLHIPVTHADAASITKRLTKYEFDDMVCKSCEFRPERPSSECRSCSAGGLLGITCLASPSIMNDEKHISIPYGELHRFEKTTDLVINQFKVKDLTNKSKYREEVEFTGELRDYQIPAVEELLSERSGLLMSAPRTGKTVMFIAAAVLAGYRTCIIADQKDFLDGFMETIEALTNMSELEEETGRKLFGFPKTIKDYDNYEIALVTYQSLSQDSKTSRDRLEAVNRNYGTVLVDEAHRANALVFSKLLNSIRAKHRWACTATPVRKDGKQYVLRSILGPIVASTDAKSLNATICVHKTHKRVTSRNKYSGKAGWVKFCQFLAKHPDRNAKIIKWLIKDIDKGRSIALPVMFTDHAKLIVDAINEHYEDEVAICFLGGAQQAKLRKGIVDRARAGEIKLIVGTRRLIQVGINIPQWDTLYYIMPMNNEPNWYQESCRILTPLENKKTPIIRLFLDSRMDRAVQCFRQVLKFSEKLGYKQAPKTPRKLRNWLGVVAKEDVFSAEMPDYFEQGPTRGVKVNKPAGRQL